jgi:predicted HD phosphohydrolase
MDKQAVSQQPSGIEAEIDALIAEFGGDSRAAIAALLHDLAVLAMDANENTSRGYVRGKVVRMRRGQG